MRTVGPASRFGHTPSKVQLPVSPEGLKTNKFGTSFDSLEMISQLEDRHDITAGRWANRQ
jgi:hypothetical protein